MDPFETWYGHTLSTSGVDDKIGDPGTVVHIVTILEAVTPAAESELRAA